jgi:hypothetical protein
MAAPETGVAYRLENPNGGVAVFNDQVDPDYVGMLTEITGFDSPEVRENADDLVQMDGGIHGDFFYGRRPVTMTGMILNPQSAAERNARADKLSQATDAMRGDATLYWTPSGGVERFLKLRRAQPLRIDGAWQKTFQVAMVAEDPRIYSAEEHIADILSSEVGITNVGRGYDKQYDIDYGPPISSDSETIDNAGTATMWPIFTLYGGLTNPVILNMTTGEGIYLVYSLGVTETMVIDTLNRTIKLNGDTDRYGALDFARSGWSGLAPGPNDIRLAFDSSSGAGAKLRVSWRDAWL